MIYKSEPDKTIIDGLNSVEKVIETLRSFLSLSETEINALSTIRSEKDLMLLNNHPENYFSPENVKSFLDLKELMDLMGGIYYA